MADLLRSALSIAEADALVPHLRRFTARPRTAAEIEEMLAERLGGPKQGVRWALRTYAPLLLAPDGESG